MTFFNKKTEVMKVELTPIGRYKLSVGKLKPHHYRFFDNNVIYDVAAMSSGSLLAEAQNDADKRIRQETPILKQNPNITGVETMISIIETDQLTVQLEKPDINDPLLYRSNFRKNKRDDHINQLIYNIGTAPSNTRQSPSYQVNAFRGKLSGSTSKFYDSANIQTSSVPQIDLELEYKVQATYSVLDFVSSNMDLTAIGPFADGSRLIIKKQDPLIRVKESSTFDEKENFHITAFKVSKDNSVSLIYEKMTFPIKHKKIMNDLYVPGEEPEDQIYDSTNTSYFFDILVDKEISDEDYCKTVGDLPVRNIYLDEEIICSDEDVISPLNVYTTQVNPDDLEDCD